MSLLALVPFPYRVLALVGLTLAVFGYGYVKGTLHGEVKLNEYRAASELAASTQERATARIVNRQKEVSGNVSKDYEQRLAALRARYAGMRDPGSGGGIVPAAAADSQGADGAAEKLLAHCPDPEFTANAAEDALKIVTFQQWAREQGFKAE